MHVRCRINVARLVTTLGNSVTVRRMSVYFSALDPADAKRLYQAKRARLPDSHTYITAKMENEKGALVSEIPAVWTVYVDYWTIE